MSMDAKAVSKAKDKAEKYFSKGRFKAALSAYEKIRSCGEKDTRIYVRMAEISRKLDDKGGAAAFYGLAVDNFAKQGFIVKAIALCKAAINMDPSCDDMQARLSLLYARQNELKGGAPPPAPPAPPAPEAEKGVKDAEREEGQEEEAAGKEFPRTPLFSDLKEDELIDVIEKLGYRSLEGGSVLFSEGDSGDSIFIVADGELDVSGKAAGGKDVSISRLKQGDFFGEFAFFSNAKRSSTVTASTPVELLELKKADLNEITGRHPRVSRVLFDFYNERVLDRLMALSDIFSHMTKEDRKEVISRLSPATFEKGDTVMKRGEKGDAMYFIVSGRVSVHVGDKDGGEKSINELAEGDFFGEVALATNKPRLANVTALTKLETVVFKRDVIKDVLVKYPEIREVLKGVIRQRVTATPKT